VINKGPEKHFIQGNVKPVMEKLKEMDCRWDPETKAWYHHQKDMAEKAQELVAGVGARHYISEVPYQLNEQVKQMGCRWDPDAHSWYHNDPAAAEKAQQLVQEARDKSQGRERNLGQPRIDPASTMEVEHGM
jgi:hypothetical protein